MRLVDYNIAVFEKNNAGIASFLSSVRPDIVCLQEVTRAVGTSVTDGFISLPAVADATPGLTHSFYGPLWLTKDFWCSNFHGHDTFRIEYGDWMEFGLYTASRYPMTQGRLEFVQGAFSKRYDWSDWPDHDDRAIQYTDLSVGGRGPDLRIINYHGIWTRDKRGSEATLTAAMRIRALGTEVSYPVIICGDFNLFPDTDSIAVLSEAFDSLVDGFGIPRTRPASHELNSTCRNVIDYVFATRGLNVTGFEVPETEVSDHLPLILDFEL